MRIMILTWIPPPATNQPNKVTRNDQHVIFSDCQSDFKRPVGPIDEDDVISVGNM